MKKLFLALSLIFTTTTYAITCSHNEAQFIGKVKDLRVDYIDQGVMDCFFKVEFKYFKPNILCPIDEMKARSIELVDYDCIKGLEENQDISGIMIEKDQNIYIIE